MYKRLPNESSTQQFERLARLWNDVEQPKRDRIQKLYQMYSAQKGPPAFNGEAFERAFIEVMETDHTRAAIDAGAAEYDEIIAMQELIHGP